MKLFDDFMKTFRRLGLEAYHRYYSVYPGIVTDNKDPEQRGRIMVQIPSVLGAINNGVHTNWVGPHHNDLAGNQTGSFFPPYIGDTVDIMFQLGDPNYPIYKGGYWAKGELPTDFTSSYGNVRGFVFKSGQKILIDETPGKFRMVFSNPSGSQIVIDDSTSSVTMSDNAGDSVSMANGTITVTDKAGDSVQMGSGNSTSSVKNMVSFLTQQMVLGANVMSAVLGENLQSWGDAHQHIAPGGLTPAPTSAPLVPNSSRTGTPLDYKSLFIKMISN